MISGLGEDTDFKYCAHVQDTGWQDWMADGELAGTRGHSLRVEALKIEVTNSFYDVYYRAHVQNIGWQPWVKNGAVAGTTGQGLRLEAVQVIAVPKDGIAPVV